MSQMARVLHEAADNTNDAHDHDEYHAAAAIAQMLSGEEFNADYVIRWFGALTARVQADQEEEPT